MKIVTYNTGHGKFNADYYKGKKTSNSIVKNNVNAQINLLESINADFILTQENSKLVIDQHLINQFYHYKKELKDYYSEFYSSSNLLNLINIGNATFSKLKAEYLNFSTPFKIPGVVKNFRRINKGVLVSKVIIEKKVLLIFNIHLVAYKENKSIRTKQIAYIFEKAIYEYLSGNYVIIGGDFNHDFQTDDSFLKTYEFLGWKKAIPNKGTIRSNLTKYTNKSKTSTIDGFICSPNINVIKVESLFNFEYSDHSPVIMDFYL